MKPFLKSKEPAVNKRVLQILKKQNIKPEDFLNDEIISEKEIDDVLEGKENLKNKEEIYHLCKKFNLNPFYLYHGKGAKEVNEDGHKYFFDNSEDETINDNPSAIRIRSSKLFNELNIKPAVFVRDEVIPRRRMADILINRSKALDSNEIYYLYRKLNINPFYLNYGIGAKNISEGGHKYFFDIEVKSILGINPIRKTKSKKISTNLPLNPIYLKIPSDKNFNKNKKESKEMDDKKFTLDSNVIFSNYNILKKEKYCFVLMPFSEKWSNRIWKHINKIVSDIGWTCKRGDDLYGHDVLEDIWVAINEAEVIIADITNRNANVFYEIGIAHTLGKKVILITQDSNDIPFDLLRFRHLIYEDNTDGIDILERELENFIKN